MNRFEREIKVPQVLAVLENVPELAGLDDETLMPLAKALELVPMPPPRPSGELLHRLLDFARDDHSHWITHPDAPLESRPLSIVIEGQIRLEQIDNGERAVRTLGRGTMFNEEGVAAAAGMSLPPGLRIAAAPVGRAWLLQLPTAKAAEVLGTDPTTSALLARVLRGFESALAAPRAAATLKRDNILSNVRLDDLYELMEGAPIIELQRGERVPSIEAGEVPGCFFAVVRGALKSVAPNAEGEPLEVGTRVDTTFPVAITQTVNRKKYPDLLYADEPTTLMQIGADRFQNMLLNNTVFFRAVSKRTDLDEEKKRRGPSASQDVILIVGKKNLGQPLGPLTDLLAEAIASHMYDRTCVLHVLPAGDGPVPEPVRYDAPHQDDRYAGTTPVAIHYVRAGTDDSGPIDEAVAKLLATQSAVDDDAYDVILIDVSALTAVPYHTRLKDAAGIKGLTRVAYGIDDPLDRIPFELLQTQLDIVTIGFLGRFKYQHPIGVLAEEIQTNMSNESALEAARNTSKNLASFAGTQAKRRGESATRLARRLLAPFRAGEAVSQSMEPWPPRTSRVRLPDDLRKAAEENENGLRLADFEDAKATMNRWARGVTGRRVGIALGGGGAFGYVHASLIRMLEDDEYRVPIDLISGSSFGAVIGAYYCGGDTSFERMVDHWWLMTAATRIGVVTTAGMTLAIDADVGAYDMNDIEISYFPVVTDADTGSEWSMRKGTLGRGVRASGSLPPMAPTLDGARRFLDGGLVANVPVQILHDEGAGLIIASNPIPDPKPRQPKAPLPIPVLGPFLRSSAPVDRVMDGVRSTLILMRAAGASQERFADLMYAADTRDTTMFAFRDVKKIMAEAEQDEERRLDTVVIGAVAKWRESLRRPPARFRLLPDEEIQVPPGIGFLRRGGRDILCPASPKLLGELVSFLRDNPRITKVGVGIVMAPANPTTATETRMASSNPRAQERADRIVEELAARGIERSRIVVIPPRAPQNGSSHEVVFKAVQTVSGDLFTSLMNEVQRSELMAQRSRLLLAARQQLDAGNTDLARLLALEAARIGLGIDIDQVLRMILHQPLRCLKKLADLPTQVRYLEFSNDGRWLARSGDCDGTFVHDMTSLDATKDAVTLPGNGNASRGFDWFPDDSKIAVTGFRHFDRVFDMTKADRGEAPLIASREFDTWESWGIFVSPDGRRIVGTTPKGAALWNFETKDIVELPHGDLLHWSDWSFDGKRLVTCSKNGKIGLWNGETGALIRWLHEGDLPTLSVAFSPKTRAVVGAVGWSGFLWADPDDTAAPVELVGHHRAIMRITWSATGNTIATSSEETTIRLWDGESGRLHTVLWGHRGPAHALDWHPRLERLVSGSSDDTAKIWDAYSGRCILTIGCGASVASVRWTHDGLQVATGTTDGQTKIWDTEAHSIPSHAFLGEPPMLVDWRPNEPTTIMACTRDGVVDTWSPVTGETQLAIRPADGLPIEARWHPDGRRIGYGRKSTFQTYDVENRSTRTYEIGEDRVERFRWRSDGKVVAFAGGGCVTLFDLTSEKIIGKVDGLPDVTAIEWDPSGRFLAIGVFHTSKQVRVWDTATPDTSPEVSQPDLLDGVWGLDWSPDGRFLAACTNGGTFMVWSVDGTKAMLVARHGYSKTAMHFVHWAPDGKRVLFGGQDRIPHVFDLETKQIQDLDEQGAPLTCGAWSHDGRRFATGSTNNSVRIWILGEMKPAAKLQNHENQIVGVRFSPDDEQLMSWSKDSTIMIHLVTTEALVQSVGRETIRTSLTEEEWAEYMANQGERRPSWPLPGTAAPDPVTSVALPLHPTKPQTHATP